MKYASSSIMHKIAAVYFLWICRKTSQKSWHTTNDYICQFSKLEIYASSSFTSHHFPSTGENSLFHWEPPSLCWSSVSAATGATSSLKFARHRQEHSQRIVPCHGLISKTWGSHQWATRGGYSMWGTEGCISSTRESCKDLRLPLIIWKS